MDNYDRIRRKNLAADTQLLKKLQKELESGTSTRPVKEIKADIIKVKRDIYEDKKIRIYDQNIYEYGYDAIEYIFNHKFPDLIHCHKC